MSFSEPCQEAGRRDLPVPLCCSWEQESSPYDYKQVLASRCSLAVFMGGLSGVVVTEELENYTSGARWPFLFSHRNTVLGSSESTCSETLILERQKLGPAWLRVYPDVAAAADPVSIAFILQWWCHGKESHFELKGVISLSLVRFYLGALTNPF